MKKKGAGFGLPHIDDINLYYAVMYARRLIRERSAPPAAAIARAAWYYDAMRCDVARFVGMAAARVKARKARRVTGAPPSTFSA